MSITTSTKNTNESKASKASKAEAERTLSVEGTVLDLRSEAHGEGVGGLSDRKAGSDKKMKHLWMVEDVPATPTREARSYWTKIGVAFENRDGSWRLELAAIPVNGRLQMRDPAPRQEVAA